MNGYFGAVLEDIISTQITLVDWFRLKYDRAETLPEFKVQVVRVYWHGCCLFLRGKNSFWVKNM